MIKFTSREVVVRSDRFTRPFYPSQGKVFILWKFPNSYFDETLRFATLYCWRFNISKDWIQLKLSIYDGYMDGVPEYLMSHEVNRSRTKYRLL